jgi:hypothetical protein
VGVDAASGRRKSEEPPLLLPIVRQIPGEHDEPCGRQLDGLLADQDRANDFRREIRETHVAHESEDGDQTNFTTAHANHYAAGFVA